MKTAKMHKSKKTRLEAHGWRVGTPRQLLGLSAEEAAFVEIKFALARQLRARRLKRGLSQAEVARRIQSSQSRVAKLESGAGDVSLDLMFRGLFAVGGRLSDVTGSPGPKPPAGKRRRGPAKV